MSPTRVDSDERGIAAVWTAVILLFLIGVTALAVDTSEFFQQARSQQRAVDLACLAGAAELPADPALAVEKAADFVRPNQRGLTAISPSIPTSVVGNVSTWITGNFVLEVETPAEYNGVTTASIMRVSLRQEAPTRFGKVLGADSAGIRQEAYCGAFTSVSTGIFPVGVSAGFPGGIIKFTENQCNDEAATASGSGVCNYVEVPRVDGLGGGGSNELSFNMMVGADRPITCYDALAGAGDPCIPAPVRCDSVAGDVPCNQLVSKSGNIAGSVYEGLIGGKPANDYIGRLAYSDGRTSDPVNPHREPANGWSAVARPTGAPSGMVVWNTNLMSNPSDELEATCLGGGASS
ncbi:MAG: pilus assembly protein, partial [Acidimicrobiia bacterium]|nr:pilus assembly protein [Acidimicrobiia bacterium]